MLADSKAYSGFAVKDMAAARQFYEGTLGLRTSVLDDQEGVLVIHLPGDRDTFVYAKPDHQAANYTILNFPVEDLEGAVDGLTERGVEFERYEGFEQDERGIARGPAGPAIAWFTDPSGNILSVHEQT
jgi:predicted enzyme related to lactoylglutathione lyase